MIERKIKMKIKMKRIISFVLSVCLLLSSMSFLNVMTAQALDYDYTAVEQYSVDTAMRMSRYSMLAYEDVLSYTTNTGETEYYSEENSSHTSENNLFVIPSSLSNQLIADGYYSPGSDFWSFNYGNIEMHDVSYTFFYHETHIQQNNFTIMPSFFVIIRGTDGIEWKGNMQISGESYDSKQKVHYSFEQAKEELLKRFENFRNEIIARRYPYDTFIKDIIYVTGHSRGAAVANLVAAELTDKKTKWNLGSVVGYTFATPNVGVLSSNPYTNIFNHVFEDDFVPSSPLPTWGYSSYGILYKANAENLYKKNSDFRKSMDSYVKLSKGKKNAKFCGDKTTDIISYIGKNWKTVDAYYNSRIAPETATTLYGYMYDWVAEAAMATSSIERGYYAAMMMIYLYPYNKISRFFVSNSLNNKINNNHQAYTYYTALKCGAFEAGQANANTPFAITTTDNITLSSVPTTVNTTETNKIKNFLLQDNNLSRTGWSLDDYSTWSGVVFNSVGNITAINIEYLDLTGALDLSGFSSLQELNCDGNHIDSVDLSGCPSLKTVNYRFGGLAEINLSDSTALEALNVPYNELAELDVSDCTQLIELNCSNNKLNSLDLSLNSTLTDIDCEFSELYTLTLPINSTNSIDRLYCEYNYLINLTAFENLDSGNDKLIYYANQLPRPTGTYNVNDVDKLKQIASQSNNDESLDWLSTSPHEWRGVTWIYKNGEYYVETIDLLGGNIKGNITVDNFEELRYLNLSNSNLPTVNISNCSKLEQLFCTNSNITSLNITNCPAITMLRCNDNKLSQDNLNSISNQLTQSNQLIKILYPQYSSVETSVLTSFAGLNNNNNDLSFLNQNPESWNNVTWKLYNGFYRITDIDFSNKNLIGQLDLSSFDYLTDFNMRNTGISKLILPIITNISYTMFEGYNLNQIEIIPGAEFNETEVSDLLENSDMIDTTNSLNITGNENSPWLWKGINWSINDDGTYRMSKIDFHDKPISGYLSLMWSENITYLDIYGTQLEGIMLPHCKYSYEWAQAHSDESKCESLKYINMAGVAR